MRTSSPEYVWKFNYSQNQNSELILCRAFVGDHIGIILRKHQIFYENIPFQFWKFITSWGFIWKFYWIRKIKILICFPFLPLPVVLVPVDGTTTRMRIRTAGIRMKIRNSSSSTTTTRTVTLMAIHRTTLCTTNSNDIRKIGMICWTV